MIDNKLQSIADAVKKIISPNENTTESLSEKIDPNVRTKDTTKGREPTTQKDDVGPGSDGKSTKVKLVASEDFKERLVSNARSKLDEASEDMLNRYMKSRGYNPITATKDQKIAMSKSNEFKKWVVDHQFEEVGYNNENYTEEQLDEMINEVLSKSASAGDWIHDFVHSDNPKFKGKSKAERKKQALAAYYATQKEEVELEEGKRPEGDSVPWVDDKGETSPETVVDKGGAKHTPMSRAKHLARMSLKKVKKEVGVKEEVEQIDEISAGLASRYLSKKRDRDYEKTGPHTSQRKEPQTMDQAMKDGKNSARALKRIGDLRKKAK